MRAFRSLRGLVTCIFVFRGSKAWIPALLPAIFLLVSMAVARESENSWVEKTLKHLSLRDKIAQLVQVRVPGKFINRQSPEFLAIADQIRQNHVGGVVLFAGNVYESAVLLNELQTLSRLPLLVAADFERGVSFRIADTTSFPWTMAIGATGSEQYSYEEGFITGQEARALGVHWIFAPVVDVNNNPDNPVINIRSYGEDPALVARLGAAFVRGARKAGVLTTAKHFPGHGDTATDSHIGLPVVQSGMDRLQKVEFIPFKSAIEAGVDSIMTAHVAVPEVTNLPELPATLSPKILTDLLRNTLKFQGIVVTDALEMGGITNTYWCGLAAVRALQAGADVLLLPTNDTVAINEVERAVRRGDISETRIDQSVRRILEAKSRMGLQRTRTVPIRRIGDIVASTRNTQLAQEIADHSITVVRDDQKLLPLNPLKDTRVLSLILASDLESSPGSVFQAEMRRRFSSVRTMWANARIPDELRTDIDRAAAESDLIICSTISRLNSGQDKIAIPQNQQSLLKKLIASRKPLIWISFGNPYVLRVAPEVSTYICTFSYSDVSQTSAAKVISGQIEAAGKMPISIPGDVKAGDGLRVSKLPMILQPARPDNSRAAGVSERAAKLLQSFIQAGAFAGAELLVGFRGEILSDTCAGRTGPVHNAAAVSQETAFELSSLSKPIETASAAMLAIDAGTLLPGALVSDYLPEFKAEGKDILRVRDLLPRISSTQTTEWVNEIVARASGAPTNRLLELNLFGPLGFKSAFRTNPKSGSTGLKCRARDIAVFAQMLLNRGMYDHRRFFKPDTVVKYTGPGGMWSKPSKPGWTTKLFSPAAFGHTAMSGPLLWIDPEKQLFVVLLTSSTDTSTPEKIEQAQQGIAEFLLSEIAAPQ